MKEFYQISAEETKQRINGTMEPLTTDISGTV